MANKKNTYQPKKKSNPVDETAVNELQLYYENHPEVYRQKRKPIYSNLEKKKNKSTYNPELAERGIMYAVEDANKRYFKEFGYSFPKEVRREVARRDRISFEEDYRTENYMWK